MVPVARGMQVAQAGGELSSDFHQVLNMQQSHEITLRDANIRVHFSTQTGHSVPPQVREDTSNKRFGS